VLNSVGVRHLQESIECWFDAATTGCEHCLDDARLDAGEGLLEDVLILLLFRHWARGLWRWRLVSCWWCRQRRGGGGLRLPLIVCEDTRLLNVVVVKVQRSCSRRRLRSRLRECFSRVSWCSHTCDLADSSSEVELEI